MLAQILLKNGTFLKKLELFYREELRPENYHANFLYVYLKDHTQVRRRGRPSLHKLGG